MGTTPVTQDPDATFMQEYMITKITTQPDGTYSRMPIFHSHLTMLYVPAEPGLWPNIY